MKSNLFKYVFAAIIVGLVIYGIYFLAKQNKEEETTPTVVEEAVVTEKKNLRIGIAGFDNINPLISQNKDVLQIAGLVFEPLLKVTQDYGLEMCLAKEVSKLDDITYLVKIDNQTKWQDNTPFMAKDIQFTIDRLKEGKSVYSYNVESISQVEIIDASTIKIILKYPVPFFEYNLTFPILSNHAYMNQDMYTSQEIPIGTGLFRIESVHSTGIELVQNESYREKEDFKIDKINVYFYGSMGEVYNSFKIGNIDFFATTNRQIEEYIGTMGYSKKEYKGREFDFLAINHTNKALAQKEVRQAIRYAIDQENLLSSVLNNKGYRASFPLDYGSFLYPEESLNVEYSIEKAKQTLVNGGWIYQSNRWQKVIDGKNVRLDFELVVWKDNGERLKAAEIIKEQLESIGIKITLKKVNNDQYNQYLQNRNFELMVSGIYNSNSPDLNYFLGEGNIGNYQNSEIKTLLTEVQNITNRDLLKEKYSRIIEICKEDVPFIGLYRNQNKLICGTNLVGNITPNNYSYFYHMNEWIRK